MSWADHYRPVHRFFSGLFTATGLLIAVFLAYVASQVVAQATNNSIIESTLATAQSVQRSYFGTAALFGALTAVAGARAHWLPALGLLIGALTAIPAVPIPMLPLPVPAALDGVLTNLQSGGVTVAFLAIPTVVVLTTAATKLLPPTPPAIERQRQIRRARVRQFLGRRTRLDARIITTTLAAVITVIPSGLVGYFVLRDNVFFRTGSAVFDTDGRELGAYAPSLFFGGAFTIVGLAAIILICQKWTGRIIVGALSSLALLLVCVVGMPWAIDMWNTEEERTGVLLRTTEYPFDDNFYSCGVSSAMVADDAGVESLWQVHTARSEGSGIDGCNRLVIYRGWEQLGYVDAPAGQVINGPPESNGLPTVSGGAGFWAPTSDGGNLIVDLVNYP
ncbi:hypothetical protein [Cryobacterium sp. AP23]